MKIKNRKILLFSAVALLIIALPIGIYLTRTQQLFRPKAAFGEVTVNLVPLEITKNIGEQFLVDVYVNTGTTKISAITISLSGDRKSLAVNGIGIPQESREFFTELIYGADADPEGYTFFDTDPFTFTVLSKKPTSQLPSGNIKVATLRLISYSPGTQILTIDTSKSEAVGYNGTSEDVSLGIQSGTQVSYTTLGSLCRIAQCVENPAITIQPRLRPDNRYNTILSFPQTTGSVYKIYRATGTAVPENHPDENLVSIAQGIPNLSAEFEDTNNGAGFAGETNLHYDIDTYFICNVPTPTQSQTTITPTPTP